jgi:hypothetical protein
VNQATVEIRLNVLQLLFPALRSNIIGIFIGITNSRFINIFEPITSLLHGPP